MPARRSGSNTVHTETRAGVLFSLGVAFLAGPVVALANQQTLYSLAVSTCGHEGAAKTLHAVPIAGLIVTALAALLAFRHWRRVGRGVEDEFGSVDTRTRFLAIGGMGMSAIAALLIVWQWVAVLFFSPCASV